MKVATSIDENITSAHNIFPIKTSFDFITRDLYLGDTRAYWIGINGFCKTELLQQIFSDLQNPLYMLSPVVEDIEKYMNSKIGYAQVSLTDDWDLIIKNVLSGPTVLFIDGFSKAILLDVRNYPTRGIEEPDVEKVTRGSRDGFVETMLFNTNLIRRRIRSPKLTFEIHSLGAESKTDVSISYLEGYINADVLKELRKAFESLHATSLTLGSKSLEELLVKKRWFNPLPCIIFQFTQSPEDYYKNPLIGNYFRLVRLGCIFASLLLMPGFLLTAGFFPEYSDKWHMVSATDVPVSTLIFYIIVVEFILDLFKYSTSLSSSKYAGSLSIVGGLIIGDIAINLNWASMEVLFYAAITLLTSLSLSSIEFSDAIRIYRVFLIITTGFLGLWGFIGGLVIILISVITTPTFAGMSYFWPLYPFDWQALKNLLFRFPTSKAQPSKVWKRKDETF